MPVPPMSQIKDDVVDFLNSKGGQASTSDIHQFLAEKWNLTPDELRQRDKAGGIHYKKQIDGTIAQLVKLGQISHPQRGECKSSIEDQDRDQSAKEGHAPLAKTDTVAGEHEKLTDLLESIGKSLCYVVKREQGAVYRHDLSFSRNEYQSPRLVIEVCDKGNIDKDITSLKWAVDNLECKAILVTVDDRDYQKATGVIGSNPDIIVVKAEAIHQLSPLVNQIALLRMLFGN